jgi:hypothetical protein
LYGGQTTTAPEVAAVYESWGQMGAWLLLRDGPLPSIWTPPLLWQATTLVADTRGAVEELASLRPLDPELAKAK